MNSATFMTRCLALLLLCAAAAPAANLTWSSTSSTDFNNAANWTGGTPDFSGFNDVVNFPSKGTLVDPALTADASVAGLGITSPGTGKAWQLGVPGSTYVLHVGTGGVTSADFSAVTNSIPLALDVPQVWNISATSGGITFNGALSSTGRVTKAGAGILKFYSTNAVAFSGGVTLQAGQILFTNGNVFGSAPIRIAGSGQLTPNVSGLVVTNAVQVMSAACMVNFGIAPGAVGPDFSGPWTLNRQLFCQYANSSASSANLKLSGSMVGPGGIVTVQPAGGSVAMISLTGTPKRFTGPIIAGALLNAALDIGTTTTPAAVYVRLPSWIGLTGTSPLLPSLQVNSAGTLGSGPVEIQAGGLSVKAATCLAGNSSVRILRSPYHLGYLSVQYNGALPSNLDLTNSTGFIALDTAYSTAITTSLSNLFLGATAANTYSGSSLAAGSGNTWRLGAGCSTLTLDAAGTAGVLTGAGNSLVVGVPAARLINVNNLARSSGCLGGFGTIALADDNDFGGSITVNNHSTLSGVKPATLATLSPLGANGTDKNVTLEGGYLRLDNTTAGTNGLAVSKGVLTVSGRGLVGLLASATRTASLTFDSFAFDSVNGGALFLNDNGTSLGNYGRIKITSLAATNLVSPRILGGAYADFLQYDPSLGLSTALYASKSADFTPVAGEITLITNSLAMAAGSLQALHLSKGTVTNSGTVNIASGGLSVDGSANIITLTNGTVHFGPAGDGTVEGLVGVRCDGSGGPNIAYPFFLHTALDGGNGVTFFGITDAATITRPGGVVFLDGAPTNQPITGSIKVLDNMSLGVKYATTRNFGPTGAGATFPGITNILLNGGRLLLSDNSLGVVNITIGQTLTVGPHGAAFVSSDTAGSFVLTLNGNLLGTGPLTIDGGGNSTFTTITGANSGFSGDVTIGGGTHYVTNNSSLGAGNVLLKLGSGSVSSKLHLWSDNCIAANRTLGIDVDPGNNGNAQAYFRSSSPSIGSLEGVGGTVSLGPAVAGLTTLTIGGDNRDTFYAGNMQDNDTVNNKRGALVKTGSGALTLLGTCTYTRGTTINGGTIFADGIMTNSNANNPFGPVTVNSGATFGGYGEAWCTVTNKSGSFLAPGHNAPGTLSLSNLVLEAGSTATFELGGANALSNDLVVVSGNLALNSGHTLRLVPLASFSPGTYTLFTYGGTLSGTPSVEPLAGWVVKTSTGGGLVQVNIARRSGSLLLFR